MWVGVLDDSFHRGLLKEIFHLRDLAEEELAEEVKGLDVENDVDDLERAVGEMAEEKLAEEVEGLDVENDVDDLERAVGEMAEEELAEEVEGLDVKNDDGLVSVTTHP